MIRKIFDREIHGYPYAQMNIHVQNVAIEDELDPFEEQELHVYHYYGDYKDRYSCSDSD